MKKIFATTIVFLLLCAVLCLSATAATLDENPEKYADALNQLDLFRGTDKGFELDRSMTRAEAAAMLVRFLGAEKTAMNGNFTHPFTDVPEWADGYVGWLYQSGLTKGVSNTLYGSQQPVTAWQYATFLTRALRDDEEIDTGIISDIPTHAIDTINAIDANQSFTRGDAAVMSLSALGCYYTRNENYRPFAEICIEREMFTAEQFGEAADFIFASDYNIDKDGYIIRRVYGIEVKRTTEGGYFVFDTISTIASDGTEYDPFVYRQDGETVTIYTMDPKTLKTTKLAEREGIKGHFNYKNPFKLGDTHYIFETLAYEDKNTVLAVKNGEISEVLSFINGGETPWYPYAGRNIMIDTDNAIVMTDKNYFVITRNGYFETKEANLSLISFIYGDIVAKRINDKSVDILLLDAVTGKEKVSYNIPDDIERGEYGEGFRDLDREYEKYRYGEAGLYYHNGKTLVQVTDRPVNDFISEDDGSFVILTHKPGKRISGMVHFGGNEVMRISADGSEAYLTREDTPFSIDGIFKKDGKIHFTTATGVGMMNFDMFTYRIENNGKLTVTDFNAGRPEVMNGFTWDNPGAYKGSYIKAEQKRIEELGY